MLAPKSPPIASSAIVSSLVIIPQYHVLPNYSANVMESPLSRENKGNLLGNNPLFFQSKLALFSVRFEFREAGEGRHLSAFRMLFDVVEDFTLPPGIGIKLKGHAFGQYFPQINDCRFQ